MNGPDGYSITTDRLSIGCEIFSCERAGGEVVRKEIGRGGITVTGGDGKVSYSVDIPLGCPLTRGDIIQAFLL